MIPNELAKRNLLDGVPLLKCWREYFGISPDELERKSGVKKLEIVLIESGLIVNPRKLTLEKLAEAMNLALEQIQD